MLQVSSKILDAIERAQTTNTALTNCYVRIFNAPTDQAPNGIDIKFELFSPTKNDKQFKLRNINFIMDKNLFESIDGKVLCFEDGHFIFTDGTQKHT